MKKWSGSRDSTFPREKNYDLRNGRKNWGLGPEDRGGLRYRI